MDWRPSCAIDVLSTRAGMLDAIREFFHAREVLEVQTSVLSRHTVTEPAIESIATQSGRFLQTSPEYQMKRLLCAGAPSIFQIGPVFRAGEQGRWHNPEFTMLEWYRLGFDHVGLMQEVADLVNTLLGEAPFETRTYSELLGFDPDTIELAELRRRVSDATALTHAEILDLLVTRRIDALTAPRLFVTDYPENQAALARCSDGVARRFELIIDGLEIANGYHELVDAAELERRMRADVDRRRAMDRMAIAPDELLLAAQRNTLPECAGVAIGFDRLVALKVGAGSLAEVMPFPADRA
jgi:lysyl-tRNA synthetase class 2